MPLMEWNRLKSVEVRERVRRTPRAIVPIGSTEQHGPHLPTGVDMMIGEALARRVAEATDSILLPNLPFSCSEDHMPKPGVIAIQQDTFSRYVEDLCHSLHRNGVRDIFLFNSHGGNVYVLNTLMFELNVRREWEHTKVYHVSWMTHCPQEELAQFLEEECCIHAEELETSVMLVLAEDLVDMSKAVREYPPYVVKGLNTGAFLGTIYMITSHSFLGETETGVIGDATLATPEKGEKLLDYMGRKLTEVVRALSR